MQAGVGWDVTVSSQKLLMPEGVGESIKVDKSLLSAYSPGMRRIRNAFMKTSTYRSLGDKDIYILFLTTLPMQGEDDDSGFDGYMPYGKQFGFISSTNLSVEKLAWAAAHELGHGAFSLQHVWLEPGYSKETANLMGYTTSSELFRWQWEQIHHPQYRSNYQAEVEDLGSKIAGVSWVPSLIESVRCSIMQGKRDFDISSYKYINSSSVEVQGQNYVKLMNRYVYDRVVITKTPNASVINLEKISIDEKNGRVTIGSEGSQLAISVYKNGYESGFLALALGKYIQATEASFSGQVKQLMDDMMTMSIESLVTAINDGSPCFLERVENDLRVRLIQRLICGSSRNMDAFVKLLQTTPDNQAKGLYEKLSSNSCILANLLKGEKDYSSLHIKTAVSAIVSLFSRIGGAEIRAMAQQLGDESYYIWEPLGTWLKNSTAYFESPGIVNLKNAIQSTSYVYKSSIDGDKVKLQVLATKGTMAGFAIPESKEFTLGKPLDIVNVFFASKNPYVSVENAFIPMPAILYAYIIDEMDRTNAENALAIIKGIVEFYFPVSGVFKAYQAKSMFDKYLSYIVLTKTILDKSLENSDLYNILEKKVGKNTMKRYEELGLIFDYTMIYRDFKNKDLLDATGGLYFEYDKLNSNVKDELDKILPEFSEKIKKLKNN